LINKKNNCGTKVCAHKVGGPIEADRASLAFMGGQRRRYDAQAVLQTFKWLLAAKAHYARRSAFDSERT
jgi:hypothetical protein